MFQSFIGFMNFYQRFICNFSEIACPLHVLTHKSKDWSWGAAKQEAFNALKSAVTSALTLAFPSKSSPFHLECNASNFTTGAGLGWESKCQGRGDSTLQCIEGLLFGCS